MNDVWNELVSWWNAHDTAIEVITGMVGLLGSAVALLFSLADRAAVRVIRSPEDREVFIPRPPIRLSPASIVKGWFSTLIWGTVVFIFVSVVLGVAFGIELSNASNGKSQSNRISLLEEPQPSAVKPNSANKQASGQKDMNEEFNKFLARHPQAQVFWLVVIGLVYVRGSYVASRAAKTTTLMKFTHGLLAVATLEICAGLVILNNFPEVYATTYPQLEIMTKWGWTTLFIGCVLGAIMGSED